MMLEFYHLPYCNAEMNDNNINDPSWRHSQHLCILLTSVFRGGVPLGNFDHILHRIAPVQMAQLLRIQFLMEETYNGSRVNVICEWIAEWVGPWFWTQDIGVTETRHFITVSGCECGNCPTRLGSTLKYLHLAMTLPYDFQWMRHAVRHEQMSPCTGSTMNSNFGELLQEVELGLKTQLWT